MAITKVSSAIPLNRFSIFRRKQRPLPRLAGYYSPGSLARNRFMLLAAFGFSLTAYSIFFTLIGRFLILQFMVPLIILAMFVIWLLPETKNIPKIWIQRLGIIFVIALLCWPDYLALALPGLPWITAVRLITVPLMLIMMLCLSGSKQFRDDMKATMGGLPLVSQGVIAFSFIAFLSIVVSKDPGLSVNKFVTAQLAWTLIFFSAVYIFRKPGRAEQFGYLIWAITIFVCLLAVQEWRHSVVPWAGNIPSFLKIEDESVQKLLAGSSRAATGIYRVQSKFTTPLGFAEFLAMGTPFIVHIMMRSKHILLVAGAALSLPFIFWCIRITDSRLGVVGFFMTLLLYLLIWGGLRWHRDKNSLFGPAVVIAYPLVLAAFFLATLYVGRLRAMVWGTGAQQFSTQAREYQYQTGIPKVLSAPWGHGMGRGAETLGFTNQAGVLTIDTYYLVIGLEFGVIGFFIYYGMIIAAIAGGGRQLLHAKTSDLAMLAPLLIALVNFLVIKSIFSQQENHPLAFIFLGAVLALVWRSKKQSEPSIGKFSLRH